MGVDFGGGRVVMAQEFLDVADIDAGLQELRRGGVAEHVRRDAACQFEVGAKPVEPAAQIVGRRGRALTVDEQTLGDGPKFAAQAQIVPQLSRDPSVDQKNPAFPVALAMNDDAAAAQIQIRQLDGA